MTLCRPIEMCTFAKRRPGRLLNVCYARRLGIRNTSRNSARISKYRAHCVYTVQLSMLCTQQCVMQKFGAMALLARPNGSYDPTDAMRDDEAAPLLAGMAGTDEHLGDAPAVALSFCAVYPHSTPQTQRYCCRKERGSRRVNISAALYDHSCIGSVRCSDSNLLPPPACLLGRSTSILSIYT